MLSDSTSHSPRRYDGPESAYPVWRPWSDFVAPDHDVAASESAGPPLEILAHAMDPRHLEPHDDARQPSVSGADCPGDGRASDVDPMVSFSALDLDDPVATMLLFKQIVTMDDVDRSWQRAREEAGETAPPALWRALAEDPAVDGERVYAEAAATAGFSPVQVDPDVARQVMMDHVSAFSERDWERLVRLGVLPVAVRTDPKTHDDRLVFASHDPSRPEVARLLRQLELDDYDLRYASASVIDSVLQGVAEPEVPPASDDDAAAEPGGDSLLETCLTAAVRESATAVHVRPSGEGVRIDLRIDGRLTPWLVESEAPADAVLSAFKRAVQRIDPAEHDAAQSGAIYRTIDGRPFRFAVSVMPVHGHGARESLVIRVYEKSIMGAGLEELGLPEDALDHLRAALHRGRGLIVVAGPVDSGKSETEEALLYELASRSELVVTLEESADARLDTLPIRLNPKLSPKAALEAIARHDPDIVIVGELTHREEVERALLLAKDDHLVIASMAVRDGSAVVDAMTAMGIDPLLTAHALELVLSQRRLRRLCPRCKVPATHVDGEMLRGLGFTPSDIAEASFVAPGKDEDVDACADCGGAGYDGVCLVAEAMPISKALRRHIALEEVDEDDVRRIALREGMQTMRAAARRLVAAGESSVEELIRVAAGEH